jgi:hypothetical protein
MDDNSYSKYSNELFWCPQGGDFFVCKTGTRFVGCCSNPNVCDSGCFGDSLFPMAYRSAFNGKIPGLTCEGDTVFWSSDRIENSFYGCCNSDPFQNKPPLCPAEDLKPSFWDRADQYNFFPTVHNATPIVTAPVVLATSLLTYTTPTLDVPVVHRSVAITSGGTLIGLISTTCIALIIWLY